MSADPNLLQDGIVTVTVVYFYRGVIEHPDWAAEILASLSNIQDVFAQTPTFPTDQGFLDVQSFFNIYTSLSWDWRINGAVELPAMYLPGLQQGGAYAIYHWHNKDPSEAERVWRGSDIVFTIIQEEASGAGGHNYGVVQLGTDSLWNPKAIEVIGEVAGRVAQRKTQLMILAHEFGHNFGSPDHYNSTQPGFQHPDTSFGCIDGGYATLDSHAIYDKYCTDRIDWTNLTKASEGFIFFLDEDPPPIEPPPPSMVFIETYRGVDIYFDSTVHRCWFTFDDIQYSPATLERARVWVDTLIDPPPPPPLDDEFAVLFTPPLSGIRGEMWVMFAVVNENFWYFLIDIPLSVNGVTGPFGYADPYPNNIHLIRFPEQTIDSVTYAETQTNGFTTAQSRTFNISLTIKEELGIPTNLTISAPASILESTPFQVTGTLIRGDTGAPMANQPIMLDLDGVILAGANTDTSGNYAFDIVIDVPGVHTLTVTFSGLTLSLSAQASLTVQIA